MIHLIEGFGKLTLRWVKLTSPELYNLVRYLFNSNISNQIEKMNLKKQNDFTNKINWYLKAGGSIP